MYIISLGPHCITKNAINKMKYISPTMPFDWMFSSLPFIKMILIDNFNRLLNRDYIKSTNPCFSKDKSYNVLYNNSILHHPNITNHLLIKNELCDYNNFHMWNHYNLLEDEQYTKYKKYIDRFNNVLQIDDLKIFLYIQYYNHPIDEILDFNNYIMTRITNYKLLCIKCNKVDTKTDLFVCSYNHNNVYIYELEIDTYQDDMEDIHLDKIKIIIDNIKNS